jgi:hypothetical protein
VSWNAQNIFYLLMHKGSVSVRPLEDLLKLSHESDSTLSSPGSLELCARRGGAEYTT